jgi:hypothetical protein
MHGRTSRPSQPQGNDAALVSQLVGSKDLAAELVDEEIRISAVE